MHRFLFIQKGAISQFHRSACGGFLLFSGGFVSCIILHGVTAIVVWNKITDTYEVSVYASVQKHSEKIGCNRASRLHAKEMELEGIIMRSESYISNFYALMGFSFTFQ